MLGIFTGMSLIFDGGRFLFSRVPWEIVKIALPLAFAGYFAHNGRLMSLTNNGRFSFNVFGWGPFLVMLCLPMALFIILGDFGQIMTYGAVVILMMFVATDSFLYPVMGALAFVFVQVTAGFYYHYFPGHIAGRFTLWLDFWAGFPSVEWWDRSYQTANAFFALRSGGLGGTGLGLGYPDLVPLVRSDFIFAEAAEELGFIGTLGILLLYLSIVITGIRTAFSCSSRFGFLAVSALTFVLTCQIIINVGGVLNIMPLTGIVLPFLSKGGSALVTFAFLVGLIMAASHRNALVST